MHLILLYTLLGCISSKLVFVAEMIVLVEASQVEILGGVPLLSSFAFPSDHTIFLLLFCAWAIEDSLSCCWFDCCWTLPLSEFGCWLLLVRLRPAYPSGRSCLDIFGWADGYIDNYCAVLQRVGCDIDIRGPMLAISLHTDSDIFALRGEFLKISTNAKLNDVRVELV